MGYSIAGYSVEDESGCLCKKCIEKMVTPVEFMVMFKNVSSWRTHITEWPERDEDGWLVTDEKDNPIMEERDEMYDDKKHIPMTDDGRKFVAFWDDGSDDGYGLYCDDCGEVIIEPYTVTCIDCGSVVAESDEANRIDREFSYREIYCPDCMKDKREEISNEAVQEVIRLINQKRLWGGDSSPLELVRNHLEGKGVQKYNPWPVSLDLFAYDEVRQVQALIEETMEKADYSLKRMDELEELIGSF